MPAERIVAAYLRRSYASTNRPGDASEDAQLEAVRRLCGPDVTVYKDWSVSGRRDDRPDYLRLKADIAAGRITSLCAYSLSRLGRSVRELTNLVDLCQRHDVTLRTSVESLDTSSAMGRLLFTIMAGVAEFEAEIAAERSAGARATRRERHERAGSLLPGGKLPSSTPMYGFRHVPVLDADGRKIIVREPDTERPVAPIIDAYRQARSLRGTAVILNAAGIPSPRGGLWGPSTLIRILQAHDPTLLREQSATGRRPVGQRGRPARFRSLVVCHCGALMTPNLPRKQYRCARGNNRIGPSHGPTTVSERRLVAALLPEAARIPQHVTFEFADAASAERERIAEAKRRAGVRYAAGEMPDGEYLAEIGRFDARVQALGRESGKWAGVSLERPVDLLSGDPAEINEALRRWWVRIRLDAERTPTVEWWIDPDVLERQEVEEEERTEALNRTNWEGR